MGTKILSLRIVFDDISGRIYPGFEGELVKKGVDSLHSGRYLLEGRNKSDLMKQLNALI